MCACAEVLICTVTLLGAFTQSLKIFNNHVETFNDKIESSWWGGGVSLKTKFNLCLNMFVGKISEEWFDHTLHIHTKIFNWN